MPVLTQLGARHVCVGVVRAVPALAAWLRQFRTFTEGKLCRPPEITFQQHFAELCPEAKVER